MTRQIIAVLLIAGALLAGFAFAFPLLPPAAFELTPQYSSGRITSSATPLYESAAFVAANASRAPPA